MERVKITELLEGVRRGAVDVEDAAQELALAGGELDLGDARVDLEREDRCGHPEVIFGEGKRPEELARIATGLVAHGGRMLATRVDDERVDALRAALPQLDHDPLARCAAVFGPEDAVRSTQGTVAILSAGSSDAPVAAEARYTARFLGLEAEVHADLGVAGLHRLLRRIDTLRSADVLLVVAGMEGALPSVVGGLVDRPVIAIPTSVGYGASLGGLSALLGMLNSCAAGVTVVNIDNGFGAAVAASRILRSRGTPSHG